MIYVCPEKDCRVSEPCTPCICGMDKLKVFGGTENPTPRVDPPAPMTQHDKALEAAAKVLNDHGIDLDHRTPEIFKAYLAAITAYHAALEGRGEAVAGMLEQAADTMECAHRQGWGWHAGDIIRPTLLREVATLLTRLAELELERDGEREAWQKLDVALRAKDAAMQVLLNRMTAAGVDYSDLLP